MNDGFVGVSYSLGVTSVLLQLPLYKLTFPRAAQLCQQFQVCSSSDREIKQNLIGSGRGWYIQLSSMGVYSSECSRRGEGNNKDFSINFWGRIRMIVGTGLSSGGRLD